MAAPAVVVRVEPSGIPLHDGMKCVKACAADLNILLYEIETGIPGVDGGDPIDTSTQWNDDYRTMRSRQLKTLTEHTVKFAYDPAALGEIDAIINNETSWTDLFPDGSTYSYYGFARMVEYDPLVEGTMPTGTLTICPTNWDPVNRVEAGPVLVNVAGT